MSMTIPEHHKNMDLIRLHLAQTVADQDAELQRLRAENATLREALHTHGREAAQALSYADWQQQRGMLPDLLLQAAELLQEYTEELKAGHTINDEWPSGEEGAKAVHEHDLLVVTRLREAAARLTQSSAEWHDDKPDQWSEQIDAAHPIRSGNHVAYATAMQMVGNRRSKAALVELVCWLIQREQQARKQTRAAIDAEPELPGEMPDEMWNAIKNDRDAATQAMRIAVIETKRNIRERIERGSDGL